MILMIYIIIVIMIINKKNDDSDNNYDYKKMTMTLISTYSEDNYDNGNLVNSNNTSFS